MGKNEAVARATISEKGWLVIPQEMRLRHGIKKGDHVKVIDCGDFIAIVSSPETLAAKKLPKPPHRMFATDDLLESRAADVRREERDLPAPPRD
jgi:AbrB family looped-hinge helix DNA binding protein